MAQMNITPTTSIVASWRNQLHQWPTMTGEWIDNAFDAGATQITITLNKDSLTLQDNGIGCADLGLMLTAGHHGKHATTRLGRYGIGFKQAAASAGDVLEVQTIHKGYLRRGALDWKQLERSGSWTIEIDPPVRETAYPSGTFIRISKLRNKAGISEKSLTHLMKRLSEQYAPALKQGRQILFKVREKTIPLQIPSLPDLKPSMTATFMVNGKRAELLIGLIPEGHSYSKSGLTVSYGFRVIEDGKRWGLGNDPTPGLVGFLDLLDGWNLSTNKERILDEDLEELSKQIAEQCADIIALAAKRGISLPLQHVASRINTMLRNLNLSELSGSDTGRPTQSAGQPRGGKKRGARSILAGVWPPRTRTVHTTGHGASMESLPATGVSVSMGNLGKEGMLYNYQEGEKKNTVIIELNIDNPVIAQTARTCPEQLIVFAVQAIAENYVLNGNQAQLEFWIPTLAPDTMGKIAQFSNKLLWDLLPIADNDADVA